MKSFKLLAAASAAVALAGVAHAQTVVRITGSTAYRTQSVTAIIKLMGGTVSGGIPSMPAGATAGYVGTSVTGAACVNLQGTIAGNSVLVKTSWSGSVGGVQTVSNGLTVKFIPTQTFATGAGTNNVPNPQTSSTPSQIESAVPDIAMSDTFQSSTVFNTTPLKDTLVGVVPFRWVAGKGAPASIANLTPDLAQQLYRNGTLPLAMVSGLAADEATSIYAMGRDPDSGTRLTAYATAGIGVNAAVFQYFPTFDGSNNVTGYSLYPANPNLNGIALDEGQSGESSGSALAALLTKTATASTGYGISYLSVGDAATAITGGAKELSWDGNTLETSAPYTSVLNGKYSFWGYEHLMYLQSWVGSSDPTIVIKKATADAIATQIKNVDAQVLIGAMRVQRATDGGLITPIY